MSPPVTLTSWHDMAELRRVSSLLEAVWGRNEEGVPIPAEVLRAVVHAGGLVNVALDASGDLLGAAVLSPTADGAAYSMIAATAPGAADQGLGTRLKQHQRDWAVEHGLHEIRWTFDPLVARNARFNLDKLGAYAAGYEEAFYGVMGDALNAGDVSDRLVITWPLASPAPSDTPSPPAGDVLAEGPDGSPALLAVGEERWCRVPADIVALRGSDRVQALAWRPVVREWMTDALGQGLHAIGMSRNGWYRFTRRSEDA